MANDPERLHTNDVEAQPLNEADWATPDPGARKELNIPANDPMTPRERAVLKAAYELKRTRLAAPILALVLATALSCAGVLCSGAAILTASQTITPTAKP